MKAKIIEQKFIQFFKKKNYTEQKEYTLIPKNDESLLFTNSGMVQFKNIFLDIDKCKYDKVTTSQTCIRLGGKHNDLNNIGKTPHHNTSFTMLGNFCFKNASKQETITLAWDFLTNILKLKIEKLYITIHKNDKDILNLWTDIIKIKKTHIITGTDETNFWSMADTGPCGYCCEIFYNIGSEKKQNLLEIWNLVFIQFQQNNNEIKKLKNIAVDTGMGLERIASIKQNVFDSFETDILKPLINITLKTFNIKDNNQNIKIITDHIKTCILLIKDGLTPSNDGRGYILKKLIRRSIIKKKELNIKENLSTLVKNFVIHIDDNNSYHNEDINMIEKILQYEEEKFEYTLHNGTTFLKHMLKNKKNINGKTTFMLYDTYGIPLDTIKNIIKEYNIKLNINDFNIEMEKQVKRSKQKLNNTNENTYTKNLPKTIFTGYNEQKTSSDIIKIIINDKNANQINSNDTGIIVTTKTCFYSEKGGQVGDIGTIIKDENIFEVTDTKEFNNIYFHYGNMKKGLLQINDNVMTKINIHYRNLISINHSATHLLHITLKNILGKHVKQAGSLINEEYLRFDFTHFKNLTKNELQNIETIINKHINNNIKTDISILNKNEANKEKTRIVSFENDISKEFCAGTHVKTTGEIGIFKIIKEFGIGTNIRRIEAITGSKVIEQFNEYKNTLEILSNKLITNKNNIINTVENLLEKNKCLKKENEKIIFNKLTNNLNDKNNYINCNNIKVITINEEKKYINLIKNTIKDMTCSIIITYSDEKKYINININITDDINNIHAKDIINHLKHSIQIKGGGKKNIANGIIYNNNIKNILQYIYSYINNI